jgi:hypothetical protein
LPDLFLSGRDKFAKKIKLSDTAVSLQRLFEDDGARSGCELASIALTQENTS